MNIVKWDRMDATIREGTGKVVRLEFRDNDWPPTETAIYLTLADVRNLIKLLIRCWGGNIKLRLMRFYITLREKFLPN